MINCVIIHKGYQPYLKYNLEISSKNNYVYLIGDDSLEFLGSKFKNVEFINIQNFENSKNLIHLKEHFKNFNSNSYDFEWFCFARVFMINDFLEQNELENVFHIDSDNVLLTNISNLEFHKKNAYLIPPNQEVYRMSGSIHSGLIDKSFCEKFINLYKDIYVNKSKFHLIEDKINYHSEQNIPGGICDMTLYYLLQSEEILDTQNLFFPIKDKSESEFIFMNNFSNSEGPNGKNSFQLEKGQISIINKNKVFDTVSKKEYNLCNIHFQGGAKKKLNRLFKYKISY